MHPTGRALQRRIGRLVLVPARTVALVASMDGCGRGTTDGQGADQSSENSPEQGATSMPSSTPMNPTGRFTLRPARSAKSSPMASRANAGQQATVTSNGAPVAGDPTGLHLKPDQQVMLRFP